MPISKRKTNTSKDKLRYINITQQVEKSFRRAAARSLAEEPLEHIVSLLEHAVVLHSSGHLQNSVALALQAQNLANQLLLPGTAEAAKVAQICNVLLHVTGARNRHHPF